MIDPLTLFRRGIFQIREAAYLELLARAGEDGLTLPLISGTMGELMSTSHTICRRLESKGYVQAPTQAISHHGRPANIWRISEAGRDLITLHTAVTLIRPPARQRQPRSKP